ncbi:MAG: GNAT family N-acetyltransferase [Acidimicrobiales bacterium]
MVELAVEDTHGVRRRVLRDHRPDAGVDLPEDRLPGTVHLGVVDDSAEGGDAVVAVATVFPEPTDFRPGARAARLRGMAVEFQLQGQGVGALLLDAVVDWARGQRYEVLWANGRDSALGFYERHGWQAAGAGFTSLDLPHHVVLLDL